MCYALSLLLSPTAEKVAAVEHLTEYLCAKNTTYMRLTEHRSEAYMPLTVLLTALAHAQN
jgi:hypothetical protein